MADFSVKALKVKGAWITVIHTVEDPRDSTDYILSKTPNHNEQMGKNIPHSTIKSILGNFFY